MRRNVFLLLCVLATLPAVASAATPRRLPDGVASRAPQPNATESYVRDTGIRLREFNIALRIALAEIELRQRRRTAFERDFRPAEPIDFASTSTASVRPAMLPRCDRNWTDNVASADNDLSSPDLSGAALPISAAIRQGSNRIGVNRFDDGACIDMNRLRPHPHQCDFSPTPIDPAASYHDGDREAWVYDAKHAVATQHPWVQWGRVWYDDGVTPRGINWFGSMNLVRPEFYVYGDFRTGVQAARNAGGRADNFAARLNLDMDLQITDTERFHAFVGPLDENNQFTRYELVGGDLQFRSELDFTPATAFFEGDLGTMLGAAGGQSSPFELPITAGLVPLLFQNGIWMEDAVTGAAVALPARHSRLLNWSNYDATFFAVFDQLNSPAFADRSDAQAFGTAWFIEAYGGYIETGYAYLNHRNNSTLSYHNATISFTRRYFDRISNSVRVIFNAGQDRAPSARTADGGLLLVENSWITAAPLTVVPYANFFYGWNRPQSVARAGISGGILRNTGINFDTDGVNGFPTLDPTASDTAGAAFGVDLIGKQLDRQLLLEFAYLTPHGDRAIANGDQLGIGARYQFPISNATLLRFDAMHGWRDGDENIYGTRMEYRWKF